MLALSIVNPAMGGYNILKYALWTVTALFGITMGFLAVQLQKLIIILATSFFGSWWITFSIFQCFLKNKMDSSLK